MGVRNRKLGEALRAKSLLKMSCVRRWGKEELEGLKRRE